MTVLRELVARLGFQVDKAGFKEAERGLDNIRTRLRNTGAAAGGATRALGRTAGVAGRLRDARGRFVGRGGAAGAAGGGAGGAAGAAGAGALASGGGSGIGQVLATLGLSAALQSMIHMASDVSETGNVLKEVFGPEGQKRVEQWAETMGTAMGRSKYDLQGYASRLGAVLGPMVGNQEKAEEMSKTLSGLAVDLGSFFNTTDDDALLALRSGLTGEVEMLKRYGVVMNDATLQEYARTQGITKKITAMNNAEKTELRYGYILKATKAAQGDAARTSDGFANSSKALKAALKDVATDMGMTVLPKLEKVIRAARDGVQKFREFTKGTNILESAMYGLGAVAAALAIRMVLPFALPIAAVLALILLIDELYTLFTGGETVIGNWLNAFGGAGTAEKLMKSLRDTIQEVQDSAIDLSAAWDIVTGSIDDVGFAVQRLMDKMVEGVTAPVKWVHGLDESIHGLLKKIPGYKESDFEKRQRAQAGGTDMEYARAKGQGLGTGAYDTIKGEIGANRRERWDRIRRGAQERQRARAAAEPNMSVMPAQASAAVVSAPAEPNMSTPQGPVSVKMDTTIHVNGGNIPEVKRVVVETMQAERKKTMAAIGGGR